MRVELIHEGLADVVFLFVLVVLGFLVEVIVSIIIALIVTVFIRSNQATQFFHQTVQRN